jgi:hypothetical protein
VSAAWNWAPTTTWSNPSNFELLARVRTLLRRSERVSVPEVFKVAGLELDPARHRAYREGRRIDLTTKEFALLHLLMSRTGEVLTRTQIISQVWDMNFDCDTNVVEVTIRRLRIKVDDPFENKLIHTREASATSSRSASETRQPVEPAGHRRQPAVRIPGGVLALLAYAASATNWKPAPTGRWRQAAAGAAQPAEGFDSSTWPGSRTACSIWYWATTTSA